ncbi:hypothetical protein [Burkholderia territorii]|nr:hypothetical protein [Burkholderia territorii]
MKHSSLIVAFVIADMRGIADACRRMQSETPPTAVINAIIARKK